MIHLNDAGRWERMRAHGKANTVRKMNIVPIAKLQKQKNTQRGMTTGSIEKSAKGCHVARHALISKKYEK